MFLKRNQLGKRKIVGGNLIGNLFNKAKGVLYNTGKLMIPKAKSLAKMTAQKALTAAKNQISPEKVLELAKDLAKGNTAELKKKAKREVNQLAKTLAADEQLNPHLRDTISKLSQNKDVRKVLMDKGKELLQDNSRAMLSNLISGSGMKEL